MEKHDCRLLAEMNDLKPGNFMYQTTVSSHTFTQNGDLFCFYAATVFHRPPSTTLRSSMIHQKLLKICCTGLKHEIGPHFRQLPSKDCFH
jgi:hypothetical protein